MSYNILFLSILRSVVEVTWILSLPNLESMRQSRFEAKANTPHMICLTCIMMFFG